MRKYSLSLLAVSLSFAFSVSAQEKLDLSQSQEWQTIQSNWATIQNNIQDIQTKWQQAKTQYENDQDYDALNTTYWDLTDGDTSFIGFRAWQDSLTKWEKLTQLRDETSTELLNTDTAQNINKLWQSYITEYNENFDWGLRAISNEMRKIARNQGMSTEGINSNRKSQITQAYRSESIGRDNLLDSRILTNRANIQTQKETLQEHQAAITENNQNIATNKTEIAQNKQDIANNKTAIQQNTTQINENQKQIAQHDNLLTEHSNQIQTNQTRLATHETSIQNLERRQTNVQQFQSQIDSNRTAINQANQRIDRLSHDLRRAEKRASAGTAAAMAVGMLTEPKVVGRPMISVAATTYDSQQGGAIGMSYISPQGKVTTKAAVTFNSQSKFGAGLAAGYQF